MKNRYFVLRHGQAHSNMKRLLQSDPAVGKMGNCLTPEGKADVSELAAAAPYPKPASMTPLGTNSFK